MRIFFTSVTVLSGQVCFNRNCFVTRMAFELFPEIASVKTLKWPRGDSRGPFESLN